MMTTYFEGVILRDAWVSALQELSGNICITLGAGDSSSVDRFYEKIDDFFNRAEKEAHGRNWSRFPLEMRPHAYGFFEQGKKHLHNHIFARATGDVARVILDDGPYIWNDLRRNGAYYAEEVENEQGYAVYITKAFRNPLKNQNVYVRTPDDHSPRSRRTCRR